MSDPQSPALPTPQPTSNNPLQNLISGAPLVNVRTAGKDVITSGSVVLFDNNNLEVSIYPFKFIFNFIEQPGEPRIEFRNTEPTTLVIDLFSFSNSIGTGTTSPYRLGTLLGRELWLTFRVYAFDPNSCKTVLYTFMLGDPA